MHQRRLVAYTASGMLAALVATSTSWGSRFKRYPTHSESTPLMHGTAQEATLNSSPRSTSEGNTSTDASGDNSQADAEEEAAPGEESPNSLLSHRIIEAQGVQLEYIDTGEVFNNTRGGLNTSRATEYRGNIDLALTFDMDHLGSVPGGTFFLYGQDLHGRGVTLDHVGDYQMLSNLDNPTNFTQVSEFWWQQELAEGRLWLKLGKQDSNADFCALHLGGDFVGSSFGQTPTVPMPTFPSPGLGAALFATVTDQVSIGGGI